MVSTVKDVNAELSAKFPTVMLLPVSTEVNPNAGYLAFELTPENKQALPHLINFIEQAREAANQSSSTDSNILEPDLVIIANTRDFNSIAAYSSDENNRRVLTIRTDLILALPSDAALAVLTHEFKHAHHHESGHLISNNQAQQRLLELEADRAASKPVSMAAGLLAMMTSPEFTGNYYSSNVDKVHPSMRDRIRALLEEAYGNEIFKYSGVFDEHLHFQPRRQDFLAVLENGQKVANWDTDLVSAINQQVDEDMRHLDRLVGDDNQPISANTFHDFLNYINPRIEPFKLQHIPQFIPASNTYLANQFEAAIKIPALREQVMSMHESMPLAFQAYDQAVAEASMFASKDAQDLIINNVLQQLSNGIKHGEFPQHHYFQSNLQTNPETTPINDQNTP